MSETDINLTAEVEGILKKLKIVPEEVTQKLEHLKTGRTKEPEGTHLMKRPRRDRETFSKFIYNLFGIEKGKVAHI